MKEHHPLPSPADRSLHFLNRKSLVLLQRMDQRSELLLRSFEMKGMDFIGKVLEENLAVTVIKGNDGSSDPWIHHFKSWFFQQTVSLNEFWPSHALNPLNFIQP